MQGKNLCRLIANKSSNIKCVDFEIYLFTSVHCTVQELINTLFEYHESKVLVKLSGQWVGKSQEIIKTQFLYSMIYQQYANVEFCLAFIASQILLATRRLSIKVKTFLKSDLSWIF